MAQMKSAYTCACRDLGMDCDYRAEGTSKDEVRGKLIHHGVDVHNEKMQDMGENDYVGMFVQMEKVMM